MHWSEQYLAFGTEERAPAGFSLGRMHAHPPRLARLFVVYPTVFCKKRALLNFCYLTKLSPFTHQPFVKTLPHFICRGESLGSCIVQRGASRFVDHRTAEDVTFTIADECRAIHRGAFES